MVIYSYLPAFVAGIILLISFRRSDFPLSFVTLGIGTTAYFMMPGLFAIEETHRFSDSTVATGCAYITACLIALHLGWKRPYSSIRFWIGAGRCSNPDLAKYIVGGLLFGGYFSYALSNVAQDLLDQTAWSGQHTIYYFLSQPAWLTLAPATLLFFRKRTPLALGLFLLAFTVNAPAKIIGGRRDEIIEIALIGLLVWHVLLKRHVSRTLLVFGGIFVFVWFSFIGEFRQASKEGGLLGGFNAVLNVSSDGQRESPDPLLRYNEVVNFLVAVDQQLIDIVPNFGAVYWNSFVHQYVPAQIVGLNFKEGLKFQYAGFHRRDVIERGFPSILGTTHTGFACTFTSFLFLGCFVFYFASRLMSSLYLEMHLGNDVAWCVYANLMIAGAVGITHSMGWLLNTLISTTIFQIIWFRLMNKETLENNMVGPVQLTNFKAQTAGKLANIQ